MSYDRSLDSEAWEEDYQQISPTTPEEVELKRVTELWFEDGSIVIQAEHKLFRVARGILTFHSTKFAEMFAGNEDGKIDGCPLYHLFEDKADDVTFFLRAIYDSSCVFTFVFQFVQPTDRQNNPLPSSFFTPPPFPSRLDVVLSVALLSHKYEVNFLLHRALLHLETRYPLTFDKWNPQSPMHTTICGRATAEEAYRVINTLWKLGARWLEPAAYYELAEYSLVDVMSTSGWSVSDTPGLRNMVVIRWERIIGSHNAEFLEFIQKFPTGICGMACDGHFKVLINEIKMEEFVLHPLSGLLSKIKMYRANEIATCYIVERMLSGELVGLDQRLWANLPRDICLPSWENLERMKIEKHQKLQQDAI